MSAPTDPFVEVDPGDYSLYLLGDHGTASMTITLDGLLGETSLSPAVATDYDFASPAPVRSANLYSAGGDGQISGQGMMFALARFTTAAHVLTTVDFCQAHGKFPQEWKYLPGHEECLQNTPGQERTEGPQSQEQWNDIRPSTDETDSFFFAGWQNRDSGAWENDVHFEEEGGWYFQTVSINSASVIQRDPPAENPLLSDPLDMVDVDAGFVWLTFAR